MNRQQHLDWAKQRALEYVDGNDLTAAFSSMVSDLGKHDELCDHVAIELGLMLLISGNLSTNRDMREFINGFN